MIVSQINGPDPRDVYRRNAVHSPGIAAAMLKFISAIDDRFPSHSIPVVVGHNTLCFCENETDQRIPIASVNWLPQSSVFELSAPFRHFAWDDCELLATARDVAEAIEILIMLRVLPGREA
jgi:hypothetical protein